MKKIIFNDKYGLTAAVLNGKKTMTRRTVKNVNLLQWLNELDDDGATKTIKGTILSEENSAYKVGEIVAVAQRYKDIPNPFYGRATDYTDAVGWENKMFVRADLMPHHIRITDIKVERLQDISDEECLKEGICRWREMKDCRTDASEFEKNLYGYYGSWDSAVTPRKAFEYMIERIIGKGTWESNPWVFAYTFELVD